MKTGNSDAFFREKCLTKNIVVSDKGYKINYSNQKNQTIYLEISQEAV